jgi:hypothetical protein
VTVTRSSMYDIGGYLSMYLMGFGTMRPTEPSVG